MTNLAKHLEKINSESDECIESNKNIITELTIHDKHIEKNTNITDSIEQPIGWSKYLLNIIASYFGFLLTKPKFLYKNNNDDFFDKFNKVKKMTYLSDDELDMQNDKLIREIDNDIYQLIKKFTHIK
jgi:hypothetical protein